MTTLSQALGRIVKENPETIVVLKTERYGMFWAGKAKFASSAITFDAGANEVKATKNEQYSIALTI